MGAETSSLRMSGVTIGESVPLKSPHPSPASSKGSSLSPSSSSSTSPPWTLHRGEDADGKSVSLFVYPKPDENSGRKNGGALDGLPAAFKHAKVLRHPSLVKFQGIFTASDGRLVLVTEPVAPLITIIESMTVEEITAGIYSILSSLVFLHDRVGVCHNNVALSSVFVSSDDGAWKLGALDHLKTHDEATWDWLRSSRPRRDAAAITPEEKQKGPVGGGVEAAAAQARDAYAFGQFTLALLQYIEDENEGEEPRGIEEFKALITTQFLHADPKKRPRLSSFLNHVFFKNNNYCDIINFLDTLPLKTSDEKEAFFKSLSGRLSCLSPSLVAFRLVRPLLRRFVLVEPSARLHFVPHLLTPKPQNGDATPSSQSSRESSPSTSPQHSSSSLSSSSTSFGILTDDLFAETVIPHLCKIVLVRDHDIFLALLRLLPQYLHLIPREKLEETFLPQMLLGLQDASDDIVAASLGGLSSLVPILGGDAVIGLGNDSKANPRRKIFAYGAPRGFHEAASPSKPKVSPAKIPAVKELDTLLSLSNRLVDKRDTKRTREPTGELVAGEGGGGGATSTNAEEERRRNAKEEKERKREERSAERKTKMERKKLDRSSKKEASPAIRKVGERSKDDLSEKPDTQACPSASVDSKTFSGSPGSSMTSPSVIQQPICSLADRQSTPQQQQQHQQHSKPRLMSDLNDVPQKPLAHVTPYVKTDTTIAAAPMEPPIPNLATIVSPLGFVASQPSNASASGDWPDWSNDDTDDDVGARSNNNNYNNNNNVSLSVETPASFARETVPAASTTEFSLDQEAANEGEWSDEDWGKEDDWNNDDVSLPASQPLLPVSPPKESDDAPVVLPLKQKSPKGHQITVPSAPSPSIKALKLISSPKQSQASPTDKGDASTATTASTTAASVERASAANKDLGSEFDVKAIRVRKKEETSAPEEVDFFADMMPDFGANSSGKKNKASTKFPSASPLDDDASVSDLTLTMSSSVTVQSSIPVQSKFGVVTTEEEDGVGDDDVDGWGDADDVADDWDSF